MKPTASLYRKSLPDDLHRQLAMAIEKGCERYPAQTAVQLFFRADDIGIPSAQFRAMVNLFRQYDMPLCLAVVPSWLNGDRLAELTSITSGSPRLWCWHQHGRLHRNFEPTGKKQEFGPARDYSILHHQVSSGMNRLQSLLGDRFQPYFTPPWNRCSRDAARALRDLKFAAVSRSSGAKPELTDLLPDFQVNVDLHTRKETDPDNCLANLLAELESALASGRCGIMLHHQRMNHNSFLLLNFLLTALRDCDRIQPCHFGDLL